MLNYRQVSNIRHTLVGNKIVDHSDVVGASPVGAASTTSSLSTHGFIGWGQNNHKTRREAFKFWDLGRLILDILRYVLYCENGIIMLSTWYAHRSKFIINSIEFS